MSKQPRDESNYPIPLLGYKLNGAQQIVLSETATRSTPVSSHTRVISVFATVYCFFEIGDSTVTANLTNSHILPAGIYMDISMGSDTNPVLNSKYLSVISTGEGMLYLSERI